MNNIKIKRFWFFFLAVFVFALDQATKYPFRNYWKIGESYHLSPVMYFTYLQNTGSLWGMFSEHTLVLGMISLSVSLGIVIYAWRMKDQLTLMYLTLGILLGGAMGNMYDRLVHGFVVDFFDLRWHGKNIWAIFNVADIAIDVAIVLFIWMAFTEGKSEAKPKPLAQTSPEDESRVPTEELDPADLPSAEPPLK